MLPQGTQEEDRPRIPARMVIATRVKDWHDYHLLHPRPNYLAHLRRLSITDVVLSVCGTMVDVQLFVIVLAIFDVLVSVIDVIVVLKNVHVISLSCAT
jgi:hypothetical protein